MTRHPPRASLARRLALVALGIVLALVLSEALLQAGARLVRPDGQRARGWSASGRRIVCIGDSNTYGLYLERSQAYPAVLQRRWDAQPELAAAEILNLGLPGTNSSRLRRNLDRVLDALAPDVVLIMIGANDSWTVPVPLDEGQLTTTQWLWKHSRVFRLLYMVRRALQRAEVSIELVFPGQRNPKSIVRIGDEEIDFGFTGRTSRGADWPDGLRSNLIAMIERVRGADAHPVLLTYPSEQELYGAANQVIRSVAAASGAPLIDTAAALRAACPSGTCREFFLPDYHATARGNEIVAEVVAQALTSAAPAP